MIFSILFSLCSFFSPVFLGDHQALLRADPAVAVPAGLGPSAGAQGLSPAGNVTVNASSSEWSDPALAAGQPVGGGVMAYAPLFLMLGVMYVLVLRPQQKKAAELQKMLKGLKAGDEVVTSSGLIGKIHAINDASTVVTLEIAHQVRVKLLKSQVAQIVKGEIKELS